MKEGPHSRQIGRNEKREGERTQSRDGAMRWAGRRELTAQGGRDEGWRGRGNLGFAARKSRLRKEFIAAVFSSLRSKFVTFFRLFTSCPTPSRSDWQRHSSAASAVSFDHKVCTVCSFSSGSAAAAAAAAISVLLTTHATIAGCLYSFANTG